MRQQRRLNLFQRTGDISGIETHITSVQHIATLRHMTKDAVDRVNLRPVHCHGLLSKSCTNAVPIHQPSGTRSNTSDAVSL